MVQPWNIPNLYRQAYARNPVPLLVLSWYYSSSSKCQNTRNHKRSLCPRWLSYTILILSHKHLNRSLSLWEIFYFKEEGKTKIPHKRTITGITHSNISTLYLNAFLSAVWIWISILLWRQRRHGTGVRCHGCKTSQDFHCSLKKEEIRQEKLPADVTADILRVRF